MMTLWSTIITGVVGIAGIAGAILAARITATNQTSNLIFSINEDRIRSRIADKRQVYAKFTASVNENIAMTIAACYLEVDEEKRRRSIIEIIPTRRLEYNYLGELELIAPEEVTSQAKALVRFVNEKMLDEAITSAEFLNSPDFQSVDDQIDEMQDRLFKAMRSDLGD
jgi:hypothetical protein